MKYTSGSIIRLFWVEYCQKQRHVTCYFSIDMLTCIHEGACKSRFTTVTSAARAAAATFVHNFMQCEWPQCNRYQLLPRPQFKTSPGRLVRQLKGFNDQWRIYNLNKIYPIINRSEERITFKNTFLLLITSPIHSIKAYQSNVFFPISHIHTFPIWSVKLFSSIIQQRKITFIRHQI